MILTCPNCATRFFADDEAIGVGGRRVKCDSCGTVWTASPSLPATLPSEPAPTSAAPSEPDSAPLFASQPRAKAAAPRSGGGRSRGLGLIVLLFVLVAAVLVFQPAIEKAFPGSAAVYHSLGLMGRGAARA